MAFLQHFPEGWANSMLYQKTSHAVAGLGVSAIGGWLLWAYANLGVTFFALLALVFLNVLIALFEKDLQAAIHKWLKLTGSVVLTTLIPMFSYTAKIAWSMLDTRILIGAIFVALATATIPDILIFVKTLNAKLGIGKTTTSLEVSFLQAELDKYKAIAEKQATLPNGQVNTSTQSPSNPS